MAARRPPSSPVSAVIAAAPAQPEQAAEHQQQARRATGALAVNGRVGQRREENGRPEPP